MPLLQVSKNESSLEDWEEVLPIAADTYTFPQSTEEAAPQFIRRTKAMLSHSPSRKKSHITLPVTITFEQVSKDHSNFVPQINEELSSCFSQMSIDWEHTAQLLNSAISPMKQDSGGPLKKESKSPLDEPTIPVKKTPVKKATFVYISNTGSPIVPPVATPIKSAPVDPAISAIFESSTLVSPCKKQICRPSQRKPRRVSLVKLADNCSLNFVKSPSPTSAREMGRKLFSGKHDWSDVGTVCDVSTDTRPNKNKTAVKAQSITSWKKCLKNLKDYPFLSINQQQLKTAETSDVILDRFIPNETSRVSPKSVFCKKIVLESIDETTRNAKKFSSGSQSPIDNHSDGHIFKKPLKWAVPESAVKPFRSPAKQPFDQSCAYDPSKTGCFSTIMGHSTEVVPAPVHDSSAKVEKSPSLYLVKQLNILSKQCPAASISDTYQSSVFESPSKIPSNNSPKNTLTVLADSIMGNIQSFVDTTGEETLDFEPGDDITSYKNKNVMIGYGKEFLDEGEVFSSDEEGELKIPDGEEEQITVSRDKQDKSMSSEYNKRLKQVEITSERIQSDFKLSNTLGGTENPEEEVSKTKEIANYFKPPIHFVTTKQSNNRSLLQLPNGKSELTPLHSIEDLCCVLDPFPITPMTDIPCELEVPHLATNMRLGNPSELPTQKCPVTQALICEDALSNPDSLTSSVNDFPEMRTSKLDESVKVCSDSGDSSKFLLSKDSLFCSSSTVDRNVPLNEPASNVTLMGTVSTEGWIARSQTASGEQQTDDILFENAIDPAPEMEFHQKTVVAGQQPRRRLSLYDYVTRKKALLQSGTKQLNKDVARASTAVVVCGSEFVSLKKVGKIKKMAATLNYHHLIPIHVPPIEFTYLRRVPVIQDMLINEIVNGVNFGGHVSQNLLPSRVGGRWTSTINQLSCDKNRLNDKETRGSVRRGKIIAKREEEETVIENTVTFDNDHGKDELESNLSTLVPSCVIESHPPQQQKKVNDLPENLEEESSDFFHMVCIPKVKRVTDTYMSDQTILDSYGMGRDDFEVGKLIRRSIKSADGNDIREFPRFAPLSSGRSHVGQASAGNERMSVLKELPYSPTNESPKSHIQHSSTSTVILPLSVGKYAIKDMPSPCSRVLITPGSINVIFDEISGERVEVPVATNQQSQIQDQTQYLHNVNSAVKPTVMEQENNTSTPLPLHMVLPDESYTTFKSLSKSASSAINMPQPSHFQKLSNSSVAVQPVVKIKVPNAKSIVQGRSIKSIESKNVTKAHSSSFTSEGTAPSQYSKEVTSSEVHSSESIRQFLLNDFDATPKESIFTRRRKQQMESSVIGKREICVQSFTMLAKNEVVATEKVLDLKNIDQVGKEQDIEPKGYPHIKGKTKELGEGFIKNDHEKDGRLKQMTRKRRKTDSPDKGVTDLRSLLKNHSKNSSNFTSTGKPHCKRYKNSGKGDFISIFSDFRGQLFNPVKVLRTSPGVKDLPYDASKSCDTLNEWLDEWRELAEPRIRELAGMRCLLFDKNNPLPLTDKSMERLTKRITEFGWKEGIQDSTFNKRVGLIGSAHCMKTIKSLSTTDKSANPLLKRRVIDKKKEKVLAPKVWEESLEIADADSVKQKRKAKNLLDFMIGKFNC